MSVTKFNENGRQNIAARANSNFIKKAIRNLYQTSESVVLGVGKGKIRKQYNCDARITLRDNGLLKIFLLMNT